MADNSSRGRFVIGFVLGVFIGAGGTLLAYAGGVLDPPQPPQPAPASEWGEFVKRPPKAELLEDGRSIRLLEDFAYIDPRQKVWVAKKDAVANGASIPRVFWSVTGGPLTGKFREASIIHDEACREMIERSADVHLAFYEACRCAGVPENQAKTLYAAVYHFGPRWDVDRVFETIESTDRKGKKISLRVGRPIGKRHVEAAAPEEDVALKLQAYVEQNNPSLEDLRAIDLDNL